MQIPKVTPALATAKLVMQKMMEQLAELEENRDRATALDVLFMASNLMRSQLGDVTMTSQTGKPHPDGVYIKSKKAAPLILPQHLAAQLQGVKLVAICVPIEILHAATRAYEILMEESEPGDSAAAAAPQEPDPEDGPPETS